MTGKLKQIEGQWLLYHTCYRYLPDDDEPFEPSIYTIDRDSLEYFNTIENPQGKEVEFKVIHRDEKGEIITDFHSVPIEKWTWEAKLIPPPKITWQEELKKVQQCPQRQDSTVEQLRDLYDVCTRLGFYDAGDFIKQQL